MAKLIVAALLSLLVALVPVEGLVNITGTGCTSIGQQGDCVSTDSTCSNSTGIPTCTCNTGFEPTAAKDACRKGTGMNCTADAECITDAACTTVSGTKKCTTLIDSVCVGTGQSTCPADATCTSLQCKCNSGYTANTAKSMCAQNGAVGVTVSLVLMAAAFVTSRFF